MDTLLNTIEHSKVQGYHDFMQAIILEAISRHNFTFDELNTFLFTITKRFFNMFVKKPLPILMTMLLKASSPVGIEHVRAMTSLHCSFSGH